MASARVEQPSLPTRFANSTLVEAIRNPVVRELIDEGERLQLRRQELRPELFKAQEARDKAYQELRPQILKAKSQFADQIEELHKEKDRLHGELEKLRTEQDTITHAKDVLRMSGYDINTLNREIREAEMLLTDEERELARLKQLRIKDTSKVEALEKRCDKFSDTMKAKRNELEVKQSEVDAARATLDASAKQSSPGERNKAFHTLRTQINGIQEKLGVLKQKRRGTTFTESSMDVLRKDQDEVQAALAAAEKRLVEIRESELPKVHFTYPLACRMDIQGPWGTTLRQLQLDFGVAICIHGIPDGHGYVIGAPADTAACCTAIQQIISEASRQNKSLTLPIQQHMRREIIGVKGVTADRIERESGARLKISDDAVVLTGTEEAVGAAEVLVDAITSNMHVGEIAVPPNMLSAAIGKGGETIKRIEKASGVRSVKLDRKDHKIVVMGTEESVASTLEEYRRILVPTAAGTTRVLPCDRGMVARVVGSKGNTVRGIEEATGARVVCEDTSITVTGSEEAVRAACAMIAELKRSDKRVEVDPRAMALLSALIVEDDGSADFLTSVEEPVEKNTADSDRQVPSGSSMISPLTAIQRASGCEQVIPLRVEGAVVLRGRPQAVTQAAVLLHQFLLYNAPVTRTVSCLDVLRAPLLRRGSAGGRATTAVGQLCARYSQLLSVTCERGSNKLVVSSCDAAEAAAATQELEEMINTLTIQNVRILSNFPERCIPPLIGSRGATIQELQDDTETEIAVVKELRQVQVYHSGGDQEALDRAVEAIRAVTGLTAKPAE